MQQVYLWYTVVFQIDSILQRIVTNKRSMLLILNNYVSRNLEVGLTLGNADTPPSTGNGRRETNSSRPENHLHRPPYWGLTRIGP